MQSTLTRDEAIAAFRRCDGSVMRRVRRPRLRSIARVYVPYCVFQIEISDGARRQTGLFALDAIDGTLDPCRFEPDLNLIPLQPIDSRNLLTPVLAADAAWLMLVDKLRRAVFQTGFFRLTNPRFSTEREPIIVYLPYWIGFYASGPFVRLEVLNGVRRQFEGAKARSLFETWLATGKPAASAHG